MEDYDVFVQRSFSRLRSRQDQEEVRTAAAPSSSVIRFCGRAILPPLLSEEQKQQMQARREEAGRAAARMELEKHPRMRHVQTLLRSVQQLRKTPTLEELLQECEVTTKCSPHFPAPQSSSSDSHSEASVGNKHGPSPASAEELESGSPSPLSPVCASLTPDKQTCCDGGVSCQEDSPHRPEPRPPSGGQSSSSGYINYKKVEFSVSRLLDQHFCTFTSSGEASGVGGGFLHSTSNTIAIRPDIISHPPVDGEELERSGLELYACGASSVCDYPLSEESGSVEQTDDGSCPKDGDADEGSVTEGRNASETEPGDGRRSSEEKPHSRSLKDLLKKSQEYRRHQRMLRNQSRNSKTLEGTQELPRAPAEEQSLSDKENDELPFGSVKATDRSRTKVRGGTPSLGRSQKPKEHFERIQSEISWSNASTDIQSSPVTGNSSELDLVSKTTLRNKLNSSQEFIIPADTSPPPDGLPGGTAFSKGAATVPAPILCCSPSRIKDSCIKRPQPAEGAEISEEKLGIQFTGTPAGAEEVSGVLAQTSQHIEHLEARLSGPKSLISDLESAVKESPEQTERNQNWSDCNGTQRRDGRQQTRIPVLFRNTAPRGVSVPAAGGGRPPTKSPSLNQSFDVEKPSGLWLQSFVGQAHLTPESGGEDLVGKSRVKRRLVMLVNEQTPERRAGPVVRPASSTPTAASCWSEDRNADQLKEVHAARLRALQEEHQQQQEQLLQHHRPLLAAAVKGFLTRRLLRTERVSQLLRTIRDTQQFLQSFQQQNAGRGALCNTQDAVLQERVALQLRAARYELYDIFFSLSARERMQMIGWDRELAKERELRRQKTGSCPGRTTLSAATQKSLERKKEAMIQRKVGESTGGFRTRTGPKLRADKPLPWKPRQIRPRPQRATKSAGSSKP
ncbi:uncharacterized protein si:ch73-100l22.3 isoform X3 [Oryzias melastigma]|uniref:uncharacterized protein si:ch73-100l22.3 isoform X3 n=1 Tax=Oryzias melastigma TaxID=30732 RepID=UPI000CF80A82|nr:uncharacterized protein si:ch73-100l22.3 isoform X3 [Oryzias melastigma]